jgi:peptidoglycan/xylan/chitin deacetylase (PgdA/CDA1 family)
MKKIPALLILLFVLSFLAAGAISGIKTPSTRSLFKKLSEKEVITEVPKVPETPEVLTAAVKNGIYIPILMYHYVEPNGVAPGREGINVTPENFDAQLGWLKSNGYETTTLDMLASNFASGTPLPSKRVIITFDDGYSDVYWNAFPILQKYGFQAHVFMITGSIGVPGYLDLEKIKELNNSGLVHFGSHGVDHISVASLSGNALNFQLTESKKALESVLGKPISWFCYPYGTFNGNSVIAVKNAGYQGAVSTLGGQYQSIDILYALRRTKIGNIGASDFARLIQ